MIYLIGGTPRVGKTTLAKMIMEKKGIPFIPADALTHALDHTYPQFEIRKGGWESIPDKFYPYLRNFVESVGWCAPNYVIEGDSFLPEHVSKLSKEFEIKSVFLGSSNMNLEDIKKFTTHDDWVGELPEEEQKEMPEWLMKISEMFKAEAEKHSIPYFDMGIEREKKLEEVYTYLFK